MNNNDRCKECQEQFCHIRGLLNVGAYCPKDYSYSTTDYGYSINTIPNTDKLYDAYAENVKKASDELSKGVEEEIEKAIKPEENNDQVTLKFDDVTKFARLAESVLMDWNKDEQVELAKEVACNCNKILTERREQEIESDPRFLHYDFQGWPVYKKTLAELLTDLGATVDENGVLGFKTDNQILSIYPETLMDDGMAYGVDEMFFTDADVSEDKDNNKKIYFWRDKKWN